MCIKNLFIKDIFVKKQGKWLRGLLLTQCMAISGFTLANPQMEKTVSVVKEDVPSEEFWLYVAEFSEDEDLIDPEDLMGINKVNAQNIDARSTVKHSATAEKLREGNEESL
jgi:hypothetical protein